jgi:hypothetical protein
VTDRPTSRMRTEPDWSPINIDFTADAADPVVIGARP